jgi:hypothetical protein
MKATQLTPFIFVCLPWERIEMSEPPSLMLRYTNVLTAVRRRVIMQKNLTAIGNSLGIVIEKPILELLGITRDQGLLESAPAIAASHLLRRIPSSRLISNGGRIRVSHRRKSVISGRQ